jgi:hypothetical protein
MRVLNNLGGVAEILKASLPGTPGTVSTAGTAIGPAHPINPITKQQQTKGKLNENEKENSKCRDKKKTQ